MIKKIGFIGLSHLGFVYSLAVAKIGFKVNVFDFDPNLIAEFNDNKIFFKEPNSKKLLLEYKNYIKYSQNFNDINKCDLVFFSYDTPTNDKSVSDFKFIKTRIDKTISKLTKKIPFIILSQIVPGFIEKINYPKNKLFYQVETLVFGKALKRALYPERIIIGYSKDKLPLDIHNFYKRFSSKIIVTNYITAELSKIAINLYLSSAVSTTNTINELASKINADWNHLKTILNLDKRIGKHSYLEPGLGLSGGNLERDNSNFIEISKKYNTNSELIKNFIKNSNYQKNNFFKLINKRIIKIKNIFIYGLTYKENTHSIKNSISVDLVKKLNNKHEIHYYDRNLREKSKIVNVNIKYYDFNYTFPKIIKSVIFFHRPSEKHLKRFTKEFHYKGNYFICDPYGYLDNKIIKKYFDIRKYYCLKK